MKGSLAKLSIYFHEFCRMALRRQHGIGDEDDMVTAIKIYITQKYFSLI